MYETLSVVCFIGSEKKHIKKKTQKQKFHGIVPEFSGDFVYVLFLPHKEWPQKTHEQLFGTHSPGTNPANLFMFICFSFPDFKPGGTLFVRELIFRHALVPKQGTTMQASYWLGPIMEPRVRWVHLYHQTWQSFWEERSHIKTFSRWLLSGLLQVATILAEIITK